MSERTVSASRVTWIGSLVNLVLTLLKLTAGVVGHSSAMIADAVHSFSDFATDIVVLISFKIAGKPADQDHAYGHGKYETLAAALIGGALLLVGAGIFRESVIKIWNSTKGVRMVAPGGIAFAAAVISIVIKECLYRYTIKEGRRIESQAVIANAWHHRSDAFSSIGTMCGIGGAILLGERWYILDPLAAVVASLFIFKVALEISSGSIKELTEKSLGLEIQEEILQMATSVDGVNNPHNLRTRRIGSDIAVDLHICVAPAMSVTEAHAMTAIIENKIRARFGNSSFICIHVEPDTGRV
ncbi:MAG: cation diffusion facilitator family transporter [Kiritimatiellae bacterium]|nr:cation diffusion facilitator family transporter [Kiritimatiellia bacterium]